MFLYQLVFYKKKLMTINDLLKSFTTSNLMGEQFSEDSNSKTPNLSSKIRIIFSEFESKDIKSLICSLLVFGSINHSSEIKYHVRYFKIKREKYISLKLV